MSKLTKDVIKKLISENLEEMGTTETPLTPQYTKDFQEGQMYQSAGGNKVIFKGGKLVPVEGTDPKYIPQIIRQAQLKGLRLAGQQTEVKENKVTKSYLLKIIKEEYDAMMNEAHGEKIKLPENFQLSEEMAKKIFSGAFPLFAKEGEVEILDIQKGDPVGEYVSASINRPAYTPFNIKLSCAGKKYSFSVSVIPLFHLKEEEKQQMIKNLGDQRGAVVDDDVIYEPAYTSFGAIK